MALKAIEEKSDDFEDKDEDEDLTFIAKNIKKLLQ